MANQTRGPVSGSIILGLSIIIIILMAVVAGLLVAAFADQGHVAIDPEPGVSTELDEGLNHVPESVTVSPTTGYGLYLNGSSHATWESAGTVTNGPWTVCSWVALGDQANLQATYDVAAVENGSIQLEYDSGRWMAYFDGAGNETAVWAPAPSPTNATTVCGRHYGSTLEIWVDGSLQTRSTLTADAPPRNVSLDLIGTVDEVRVSNSSVSGALMQSYGSTPAVPWDGTDRAARLMYDEGSGSTSRAFFAASNATLTNTQWTQGVPRRQLTAGTDYEWEEDPWAITPTTNGFLDDAPIAHVYWNGFPLLGDRVSAIISIGETSFILLAVALLVIPVVAIVAYFSQQSWFDNSRR